MSALEQPLQGCFDLVPWKILRQLANKLPTAPTIFPYCRRQRTKDVAVKKELPVFRVEADDIGRQHIDGKIWRKLQNVFAVLIFKSGPCHESDAHLAKILERKVVV